MIAALQWGPPPLADFLAQQLQLRGFDEPDAAGCAKRLAAASGPAAIAALFVDLGACNLLDGDVDGAVASWRRALASGQAAPAAQASLSLGLLYEHLGLRERAFALLSVATDHRVEPFAAQAALASARCRVADGDVEVALEDLERLSEGLMYSRVENPIVVDALVGLGEVAVVAGRPDRAERAWREAARRLPDGNQPVWDRLIGLLHSLGRSEEVLGLIDERSHALSGLTPGARFGRAQLLESLGRRDEAIEMVAAIDGSELEAADRFMLVELLQNNDLVNEAIDELEGLLQHPVAGQRLRAHFMLGQTYVEHGMLEDAADMFQLAAEATHAYWSPRALIELGDLWDGQGDSSRAIECWVDAAASSVPMLRKNAADRLTSRTALPVAEVDAYGANDGVPEAEEVVDPGLETAEDSGLVDAEFASQVISADSRDSLVEPQVAAAEMVGADAVHWADESPSTVDLDHVDSAPHVDDLDQQLAVAAEEIRIAAEAAARSTPTHIPLRSKSDGAASSVGSVSDATDQVDHGEIIADRTVVPLEAGRLNPYQELAPDDIALQESLQPRRDPYRELAPEFEAEVSGQRAHADAGTEGSGATGGFFSGQLEAEEIPVKRRRRRDNK